MPALDEAKLLRWAVAIKDAAEKANVAWVEFRSKRQEGQFQTFLDETKNVCVFLQLTAKALDLDLTPFRASVSDFEDYQVRFTGTGFNPQAFQPTQFGRVSMALRDIRMASKELLADARGLRSSDTPSYDLMAFGTDLGIITSALVPIAKALRMNIQSVVKMRNAIAAFFKTLPEEVTKSVPPGGPVEQVPAESIVFASWARRATIETRRNPSKAAAMLDGLIRATER